jgi:ribosomal protein S18 acetylase RimI-like enzyme
MTSDKTTLKIRRAQLDDVSLLAELGVQTFSETFSEDNTPENMAAFLASSFNVETLTAELLDSFSVFLVAEIDGKPAGYAKIRSGEPPSKTEGDKAIELVRLYVLHKWLGQGVGQALMQRCLDEARELGFQTIWLGVWERNKRAQAFYRKWNFVEVGEHTFQLGSDPQRDILMKRTI